MDLRDLFCEPLRKRTALQNIDQNRIEESHTDAILGGLERPGERDAKAQALVVVRTGAHTKLHEAVMQHVAPRFPLEALVMTSYDSDVEDWTADIQASSFASDLELKAGAGFLELMPVTKPRVVKPTIVVFRRKVFVDVSHRSPLV